MCDNLDGLYSIIHNREKYKCDKHLTKLRKIIKERILNEQEYKFDFSEKNVCENCIQTLFNELEKQGFKIEIYDWENGWTNRYDSEGDLKYFKIVV